MIDRRQFILSGSAFAAAGTVPAFGAEVAPDLKFGVISDIHIREAEDVKIVADVLKWYRSQRVDAVVVCGDIADYGLTWQMEAFAGAWEEVFPGGLLPTGAGVDRIIVTGNHDWEMWQKLGHVYKDPETLRRKALVTDLAANWQRIFGEPYETVGCKVVKGYPFFFSQFEGWKSAERTARVRDCYARQADRIDPTKPFFHVQHLHPKGTCSPKHGEQTDDLKKFLDGYPNAVCLSGHTHRSLTEPDSFWNETFVSVDASTLKPKKANEPNHGLLVRVWPNRIHFERRDFKTGKRLDPAWEVKR